MKKVNKHTTLAVSALILLMTACTAQSLDAAQSRRNLQPTPRIRRKILLRRSICRASEATTPATTIPPFLPQKTRLQWRLFHCRGI